MPIDRTPTEDMILNDTLELALRFRVAEAAEDLLAALTEARRMLVEDEGYQTFNPNITKIDAAIAKATGQ